MNLDKVEEEEEDSELPGISRNEALSDNESDNDFRNLSFEMPFTSLKEALPDDDKRPGSASLKDAALDSDKKKRKSKGKEKSTESSSRRSTVSYNLKDFARASTPDAALPPPMGAPPPPGPPLPPDLSRRGPPPPPPPPAQEVRNVATLPSLKFNAKDLKFSKKRLRNAKEILKMVDVERADMFDKYKKYKFMPMVDSREYLRTLRAEIVSISFDGIEQLTDAFLFSLHHCKLSLNSLRWISLAGCYNITDEGVYWITQAFPTLREVFLMGCRKVTEKSLYYLKSMTNLKTVDMRGTDVGIVPPDLKENIKCILSGCPVISPAPACKQPVMMPSPYRKVVILTNQNIPWNPLAILTNQKDLSPKQELLYHSDWSPFTDQKINDVPSSGRLFNVFQIPVELGLSELIISPGSIVVIPYHLSDNVSVVEKTFILKLTEMVASILTKHADCTYILLGLYNGSVKFDPVAKSEEVVECVRRRFHDWCDRLGNNLRISIHTNWRMAALTFEEQESLATGQKFLRQGKSLFKENREHFHKESKKPIRSLLGGVINVEEGVNKNNLTFLGEAVEADEVLFPWNRQKIQSQQVLDFGSKLQKTPLPLNKLQAVIRQYRIEDIGTGNLYGHMAKLLSFAELTGHALFFPVMAEKTVVTDFKFLADVFQQLFIKQAPGNVDLRALGKDVPCWTQEDMEKICPKSKATVSLLLSLLEKYGCFIKVPLDPWSNLPGVSFVYVLYKDFPDKPTVPITNYWTPEVPAGETQRDKYYFCCPGLPDSYFPNLLRHVFRLGGVVLLWRNGVIIQKGYVTILVEKIKEYQGLNVVLIQVRMPLSPQDNSPHLKTLWTTLKLYTSVMDYLMLKYKISAAKAVACTSCIPSTNRYAILESREMRRFFLEHLVRVGDQRDVRCKKCEAASIAYVQIGPYIGLSTLVPYHDQHGIALATTNPFNRCLMCENCAVSGINCPVNLRNGTSNWYCGCNIEGKLCNYCGMCQRCFMYIKKIVSTLEPAFVTPKVMENVGQEQQLVAFDTVNVVTKGSILGFIEVQKHQLDDEMTANYFPVLEVTFIEQSGVFIELKMKQDEEEKILYYNTHYGTVLVNDQVMLENDDRAACREGDRVRIALNFCDNEFTQMLIQLECNDRHIYSLQVKAQRVSVSMTALQSGVSLQLSRPQKFSDLGGKAFTKTGQLRRTTDEPAEESTDSKKIKNCGYTVASLPSALEMRMYALLDNVEDTLFGERGISFTGAGMVALPSELTMDTLQYPAMGSLSKSNYHHLCVTWNPKSGKKNVKLFKDRFVSLIKKEIKSELHDYAMNHWVSNVDQWTLSRLAHLLDSQGIPASEVATIDQNSSLLLWSWHYLLASYPAVFLPKNPQKLFPTGVYSETNKIKLEEGLRQLFRLGFWKYFLNLDFSLIGTMYKSTGWGRRVEFLSNKNKLVAYALVIQELLDGNLEKTGLMKIKSKFNQKLDLYLCPGHRHCLKSRENVKDMMPELYGDYGVFLSFIDFGYNKLESIPENFFTALPNLVDLGIGFNHIESLPSTIKHCRKLYSLQIMENDLTDLPEELSELENLSVLDLGNNRFIKIPDVVTKLTSLTMLSAPYMMLTEIPEDIGNLVNLKKLSLQGNCFTQLPKSFEKLTQLEEINLAGVPWVKIKTSNVLSYDGFRFFLAGNKMDRYIEANDRDITKENQSFVHQDHEELFHFFDENSNGVLELNEVGKLNAAMYNLFPRFGYKGKDPPEESGMSSGFPTVLFNCPNLRIINLDYQGIVSIPREIEKLTHLTDLRISNNPNLLSVPAQLGTIKSLKVLDLDHCPLLRTPPKEIRDKGFQSILAYLQRLLSGALLSKRTKLMLVGLGGAGKTSLVRSLMSDDGKADLLHGEDITDGIEINTWQISKEGEEITYNVWDFAGQTVYYNTHQFFLSNRAVYLLLWNVRLGYEHAGLDFWLSSICVQCPKVPIFVVGSHIDQVKKSELPMEEMLQRYPQIVGFHFVSSFTGQGIPELKEKIFNITLQQEYMGEHIPAVWLTFENNIASNRKKNNVIEYRMLENIANQSGIFDSSEIFQAVQFLHDLGTIQHFTNEFLKDKVVINPQWIVDVMACVVSVKSQVIKDGRLHHSDIAEVWSEYPRNLHNWLLRLTEEFDLTFPLSSAAVNLVPCLLPEKKPAFDWPDVERGSDVKETQMIYKFDYLPAGLFNRGQVRLHQLSDSSLIWKKGSFLKKNVHIALIQQTRESELVVLVQGPRPENILFLVHEVFEGLIAESFNGVQYDFLLPCPECNRMAVKDQHMFAASTIRRAIEMKAPFLQCIKYFHTISCSDLLTFLPPDSHHDFDVHLVQSIQGLKDLKKDLSADIFISHCQVDDRADKNSMILPSRVHGDLKSKGYKCWYADNKTSASTDEMAKALIDCSVFVAFVSSNYANEDDCVNIFKYARLTLRKTMVVIAVGDGFDWKQSKIGILLADEVYINMTKQKYEHYDSKFEELLKALSGKTRMIADVSPKPVVFFSYTWVNSEEAVELGTRSIPGALGYGDPRKLKAYLEEHGVSCWIDVERVGMNGLFDDIAEGLLSARLVVVCVSDEYAASQTCQIEFRYAANTLKLPIIVAAVGTGDAWRATEVGLLSVYYPIVNFQEKTKNAKKKLLTLVRERLGEGEDAETLKAQKEKTNERHKNLSFQELFELAQRKLLRQLTIYAENQDTEIYPRLLLADFIKETASDIETSDSEIAGDLPIGVAETTNGTEKKDESEKKKDENNSDQTKNDLPKPTPKLHKTVHKRLAKKSSTLQPAYKMQKFCVYILCEHDEGWHSVAEPLELPYDFGINYLESFSPYLARMTAIMKYSKRLTLACLEDEIGQDYLKWLEESPEATMSDYQSVYHRFREMVMEIDANRLMANLARCHLPNGKTIWLCPKHQQTARVTILSNQEKTVFHKSDYSTKVYSYMIQALRSMDYTQYASQFKTGRQSKRKEHGKGLKELKKANKEAKKKFLESQAKRDKERIQQQSGLDVQEASKTSGEKVELPQSEKTKDDRKGTDRQISKESSTSVSTEAASRQTSVTTTDRQTSRDSVESASTVTTPRQSTINQYQRERWGAGRQQSQDQASISSRDSTASLQRHRDQPKYSESTKTIQRAKNKSRACVIS